MCQPGVSQEAGGHQECQLTLFIKYNVIFKGFFFGSFVWFRGNIILLLYHMAVSRATLRILCQLNTFLLVCHLRYITFATRGI